MPTRRRASYNADTNRLVSFMSTTPGTLVSDVALTGLNQR